MYLCRRIFIYRGVSAYPIKKWRFIKIFVKEMLKKSNKNEAVTPTHVRKNGNSNRLNVNELIFVVIMKKISNIIVILGCLLMLYGCPHRDPRCTYEYPINIKNLKDTIKTTDTLWVENDFDSRFCLEEGSGSGTLTEFPKIKKLINDTMVFCKNAIVDHPVRIANSGVHYYQIDMHKQDGRYQLKYGIVFSDTGIYCLSTGLGWTAGKGPYIEFSPYFDTPSNNSYLLPEKLREYHYYSEKPYKTYFIAVVE